MKRKLFALSTIMFAFFALTRIAQAQIPKPGFKLKFTGGFGTMLIGDYHTYGDDLERYAEDLISYAKSLGYSASKSGEFNKINLGMEFEGEAIIKLGSFGIGAGFGYLTRGRLTDISVNVSYTQETLGRSIDPKVSVLHLGGNFYYFPPTPLNIYLYAGPAMYFGKLTGTLEDYYENRSYSYSYKETSEVKATATSIGFHAGVGLELNVAPNVAFFIEGKARYCKIKSWDGDYTYTETETGYLPYTESGNGTMYFYEEELLSGKWYSTIEMSKDKPSGYGIRNIEEFSVNLTGLSLRVGVTIKF